MILRLLIAFAFVAGPAVAADLPPPPPASAIKQVHVDYGRALHAQATAEIAELDAQLAAARDVRSEVLEWVRGQALTTAVQFTVTADGVLTLTWEHAGNGSPVRFRVYRSADGQTFSPIAETTERRFVDDSLIVGARYWYFVTAFDPAGESGPSNTADAQAKGTSL